MRHARTLKFQLSGPTEQVGNSREHAQKPCGLSGLLELEGKMAEFYVME